MSELQDVIIRDFKKFRLRINGFLRGIGVSQIIGTKGYLEIEFIEGELSISVLYPRKMEVLHESIRKELLSETQLSRVQIDKIRCYVNDYLYEINEAIKQIKFSNRG
jgi:hypothetical protein